jgi:hypothetical protein
MHTALNLNLESGVLLKSHQRPSVLPHHWSYTRYVFYGIFTLKSYRERTHVHLFHLSFLTLDITSSHQACSTRLPLLVWRSPLPRETYIATL